MKRSVALIIAVLVALLSTPSCVTSHDINIEITCEQFTENNHVTDEFQVEVGDKIRITLCSNPTTGFQWGYEMTVEDILLEEDYDYEEPENGVVGASGKEVWTFEAAEKGTTEVHLEYSRPWEGGEKEEWTYTITVTVE